MSSARLATLEQVFVECVECVLNNDSSIADEKYEQVLKDIQNKADMFTEQLQLLRRDVSQQEILTRSREETLKSEIKQLRNKTKRKQLLLAKSQQKFEEWKGRLGAVENAAVRSYSEGS